MAIYQRVWWSNALPCRVSASHLLCCWSTGHVLHTPWLKKSLKPAKFFFNEMVCDWFSQTNSGIVGYCHYCRNRKIVFKKSRATILAQGSRRASSIESRMRAYLYGDAGFARHYKAGLPLQDMEFWQFHPTGNTWRGAGVLVSQKGVGEGVAISVNKQASVTWNVTRRI